MSNPTESKIIAATDATIGDTVYLTACDAWTREVAVAEVLTEDDFDWRMAFAKRLKEVVQPKLINAKLGEYGLAELA